MTITLDQRNRVIQGSIRDILGEKREFKCVASTESLGRDGIVLMTAGLSLADFRRNPVVLYQHDAARPIGRATEIAAVGSQVRATVQMAPPGVSEDADRVWGL